MSKDFLLGERFTVLIAQFLNSNLSDKNSVNNNKCENNISQYYTRLIDQTKKLNFTYL